MLSIVIGVHHVWRHRRRADADDEDAVRRHLIIVSLPQLTTFCRVGTSASGPTDTAAA